MKRFFNAASIVLALSLSFVIAWGPPVALGVFICTACNTSQKAVAYQTLAATAQTVDSALKAYADLVVAGKVDQATQIKVFDLKTKYSMAFKAAVAAARGDMQAPTPTDVQGLADSLATLLRTILTP